MEEEIKELNKHIKYGIEQWANICLETEAHQIAYFLDYDETDIMNVCYLLQHVCSNIGIKSGLIDEDKAVEFGERLRSLVLDMTGTDTRIVLDDAK